MKFNIDKCYIIHVAHKRNPLLMTYKMNARSLEVTANHTYLVNGMNNKLSWAMHIGNTASKANKVLELLSQSLNSYSRFATETAYKTLVAPENTAQVFWIPTTRSIKISVNQLDIELRDLSVNTLDTKVMSLTR